MSTKNDGGPAFPVAAFEPYTSGHLHTQDGMTLRDYFAAKAMQGITRNASVPGLPTDLIAKVSYAMADAMLAAREAK